MVRIARTFSIVVLIILVIVMALLIQRETRRPEKGRGSERGVYGGASGQTHSRESRDHQHTPTPIEVARFRHLLRAPSDGSAQFPVQGGATARFPVQGGAARHWTQYKTWKHLQSRPRAWEAYRADRKEALDSIDHDWSDVLKVVRPKLSKDREFIGLINRGPKGKLEVAMMRESPLAIGETTNPVYGAQIPADLVAEVVRRPALFEFHTHPTHEKFSPLPSPIDIFGAIALGAQQFYAASLVIGEYGVVMYAPYDELVDEIRNSPNPRLTAWRRGYDVIAHLYGQRSWGAWTLEDYADALRRYNVDMVIYPTPRYISDYHRLTFSTKTDATDAQLITELQEEIADMEGVD